MLQEIVNFVFAIGIIMVMASFVVGLFCGDPGAPSNQPNRRNRSGDFPLGEYDGGHDGS